MQNLIIVALFCIYSVFAQGPYGGPVPNFGGYGPPLPQGPPPPMMQGGYGSPMEEYGQQQQQQLGAYGGHALPHGYGPKPLPPPLPNPMAGGYGNPEMSPFANQPPRTFEGPQNSYGGQNIGFNKPQNFGDNGLHEGFGFEGFKESNDESSAAAITSSHSESTATTASLPHH